MLRQVLRKLELFAGAGGLSYTAQELEACAVIISSWANDINPSACATYAANKPYTFVSPLPATTELGCFCTDKDISSTLKPLHYKTLCPAGFQSMIVWMRTHVLQQRRGVCMRNIQILLVLRLTPTTVLLLVTHISCVLCAAGVLLRSGGAAAVVPEARWCL
jgi:site-specific DNA-cytosine methylase